MLRMHRVAPLSYSDALKILGADQSRILSVASRLAGVAAASGAIATAGGTDFFALRDEVISQGNTALRNLQDRISGLDRFDRTQRIVAAYNVVVITAFFYATQEVMSDSNVIAQLEISAEEQVSIVTRTARPVDFSTLVGCLATADLPIPTGTCPFTQVIEDLEDFYSHLADDVRQFTQGLVDSNPRFRLVSTLERLRDDVVKKSIERFVELYRSLARDVPEFHIWSEMINAQATSETIRLMGPEITTGLSGVHELLLRMSSNPEGERIRPELAHIYRSRLARSVIDPDDAPDYVTLPTLGDQYINPRCRVSQTGHDGSPATEAWWTNSLPINDVQVFLAGHLTSINVTRSPLVVLGQPGAGKSVLTQVLAARLPEADFFPIRVELRRVPADASIQSQIEAAVQHTTGRSITWPEFITSTGNALPVVLLDGFDELLQATGMNRANYLEEVRDFQQREAELRKPVAVMVTSRTVVADRARFPVGSVVLRIEPFDDDRVKQWINVWNLTNRESFMDRMLHPLNPDVALDHPDLARQPLLLLLLALYDSSANELQSAGSDLGRADLYEKLLIDFAKREIHKHDPTLPTGEEDEQVADELRRLSVVALAMFSRGRQMVTEEELDQDLPQLMGSIQTPARNDRSVARRLSVAQMLVGRFFFIHESQATRDTGRPEKSYEFLHATFGEFLVARLVVESLVSVAEDHEYVATRRVPQSVNAGFLYATLSFAALAGRAPIVEFCYTLLQRLDEGKKAMCKSTLTTLLEEYDQPHETWSHRGYQPVSIGLVGRHARFSANLILLTALVADRPLSREDLFGENSTEMQWASFAWLWRSQLSDDELAGTLNALRVKWLPQRRPGYVFTSGPQSVYWQLSRECGTSVSLYESVPMSRIHDSNLTWPDSTLLLDIRVDAVTGLGIRLRNAAFYSESALDGHGELIHILASYWTLLEGRSSFIAADNVIVPGARLLLSLRLNRIAMQGFQDRIETYRRLIEIYFNSEPALSLILRQLREDTADGLPRGAVLELLKAFPDAANSFGLREFVDVVAGVTARFGAISVEIRAILERLTISRLATSYGTPSEVLIEINRAFESAGLPPPYHTDDPDSYMLRESPDDIWELNSLDGEV